MDVRLCAKIKQAARYCRDIETRKKVNWFLEAQRCGNVRQVCRRHGIIPKTYYFWWNRFVRGKFCLDALQCRSRRPRHSPRQTKGKALRLIRHYRTTFHYGPERIQMYLKLNHGMAIAQSTIGAVIRRERLILRRNKKPPQQKHTKRYVLPWPGDCVQMDIKYVPYKIGQRQYYVFNAIDDCSRWRCSRLYRQKGIPEAIHFLRHLHTAAPFLIRRLQLDNDSAFTYRLSPNAFEKRHPFESAASELNMALKFIPPGEKELQGKVERLHRTDDDEFFWKAPRCSFNQLQRQLFLWTCEYNRFRHHQGLGWRRPHDVLAAKYVEQRLTLPYTTIQPPQVRLGVKIEKQKLKQYDTLERYLTALDWLDSHPLPVTDVSGYYSLQDQSITQLCLTPADNNVVRFPWQRQ